MATAMKTWSKEHVDVALKITRQEFADLGLPDDAIQTGEVRGQLKTFGPWQLPVSYTALAISREYTPDDRRRYSAETDSVTAYGIRTLSAPRQSGHELEGRVSVNGIRRRGFSSSQLFEVDGKLVDVAIIHVCDK